MAGLSAHSCRGRPRVCRPRGAERVSGLGVESRQERVCASAGTWNERAYAAQEPGRTAPTLGQEPDVHVGCWAELAGESL